MFIPRTRFCTEDAAILECKRFIRSEWETPDKCLILVDSETNGLCTVLDLISIRVITAVPAFIIITFYTFNRIKIDSSCLNMEISHLDGVCGVRIFSRYLYHVTPFHFLLFDRIQQPVFLFIRMVVRICACCAYHDYCQHYRSQY